MLYREATEEETCNFLDNDFIELDNFSAENVKKANRKRIAMATELMKHMKRKKKKIIMDPKTREGSPIVWHTTNPAIKPGLVLLQKESRYAPSRDEILRSRTRSAVTFAPMG